MKANVLLNNIQPEDIAKALCLKRQAFDHESEIRLLYITVAKHFLSGNTDGLLKLDIDPQKLIRGIQFDPRLPDELYQQKKTILKSVLIGSSIRVSRSTLYKPPKSN